MLPFLPPEIILKIIRLSLPPLQYPTCRERYDILLACSLVNQSWRSMAQGELFECVWLPDANRSTMRLSDALEGAGVDLARGIKLLRFGEYHFTELGRRGPWKLSCPGLAEVQAMEMCLPLDCLAGMPSLRQLHLHGTYLKSDCSSSSEPDPSPPPFKLLEHVSISDPRGYSEETFAKLFCPSVLPALHSVLLAISYSFSVEGRGEDYLDSISAIAPQISSLAIIDSSETHELEEDIMSRLDSYTALEHLVIVSREDYVKGHRPDLYTRISTPLKTLAIIVHPLEPRGEPFDPKPTLLYFLDALRRNVPSLCKLERVSIPQRKEVLGDRPDMDAPWVELRSLAATRKFTLDESDEYQALDPWLHAWTGLLAESGDWESRRRF